MTQDNPDKKYTILDRETLFQGWFRMDRYRLTHERFDGTTTPAFTREVFNGCGHAVIVLPFDPAQDKVVMIEQFRPGPMVRGENPWLMELVAGGVEHGETPIQAAKREALEEAHCKLTDLQKITTYYPSPGGSSEIVTLYVGRTVAPEDGALAGLPEEHEDIRVHVMNSTEAISLLYSGKIRNAATLITLQWFALHRTELRSRWMVSDASTPII